MDRSGFGIFEKYGSISIWFTSLGSNFRHALLGGSVDIIAASGSSAVGAAARGAPLVIIAILGHIAYKLIAHPNITTVQGLKGKIIGSSRSARAPTLRCNGFCRIWA